MRVLITGGAGFIGSHLATRLLDEGAEVTVLDNFSTGSRENLAHVARNTNLRITEGSILDDALVDRLMQSCDQVYHLAAALHVDLILRDPLGALETNIKGTEIVLKAALAHGKRVLVTSTSEVYGKNTKHGLTEDDDRIYGSTVKTRWGYAAAKGVDELLAYLYARDRGLKAVIVRLFNTVGPRQTGTYGMVVPRFVGQAILGKTITVFGTGEQQRCFLHVDDAVNAICALMKDDRAFGTIFNIGGEEEISINDLAHKIIALTKSTSRIELVPYDQAYADGFEDMQRRYPSTERLRAFINWRPTKTLEEILQSVIDSSMP